MFGHSTPSNLMPYIRAFSIFSAISDTHVHEVEILQASTFHRNKLYNQWFVLCFSEGFFFLPFTNTTEATAELKC